MLSAQGPLFGAALASFGECQGPIHTYVYVDGFNLYYGAVKGTPFRWLDPVDLVRQLLPAGCIINKLKYFTAHVSGAADPTAPMRQQIYLSALRTRPEIEIHFGRFLAKEVWRPLTNLPVADAIIHSPTPVSLPAGIHTTTGGSLTRVQRLPVAGYPPRGSTRSGRPPTPLGDALIAQVHTMEEKGSDVNLATHLLNDAWKDLFDIAVVVSNDTDLVTPIQIVAVERNKRVYVVCPGRWQMAPHLARVATHQRHIRVTMLRAAQFPDPIPGTAIRKPPTW